MAGEKIAKLFGVSKEEFDRRMTTAMKKTVEERQRLLSKHLKTYYPDLPIYNSGTKWLNLNSLKKAHSDLSKIPRKQRTREQNWIIYQIEIEQMDRKLLKK